MVIIFYPKSSESKWIVLLLKVSLKLVICLLQEREYKEALEVFNEKSREKSQLVSKLMEVNTSSTYLDICILNYWKSQIKYVPYFLLLTFFVLFSWWVKVRNWDWGSWKSSAKMWTPWNELDVLLKESRAVFLYCCN